jgi:PAS domain S-box-containing protein
LTTFLPALDHTEAAAEGLGKVMQAPLDELKASIERSPIATVVTDPQMPDNPIVAANEAFVSLTGYSRDEIVGRNCRFLAGPATSAASRKLLREAQEQGRTALIEALNYRKDGTSFRNAIMIAPIKGEQGEVLLYVGSQLAVDDSAGSSNLAAQERIGQLTPRQLEVLKWVIQGYRNKQIAGFLGIDEKTVKMHRAAMIRRLDCTSSAEAIRMGVEAGVGC